MEQAMLPPRGAALSASADPHTAASRQNASIPPAAGGGTATNRTPIPANLLNSGRLDLLSLSGPTPLTQGVSTLVEAIGQYLKITRREGETPVDYAHRLADALKTLTRSEEHTSELQSLMRSSYPVFCLKKK